MHPSKSISDADLRKIIFQKSSVVRKYEVGLVSNFETR